MAVIAAVSGGFTGFAAFLSGLIFADLTFMQASALYFLFGIGTFTAICCANLATQTLRANLPAQTQPKQPVDLDRADQKLAV